MKSEGVGWAQEPPLMKYSGESSNSMWMQTEPERGYYGQVAKPRQRSPEVKFSYTDFCNEPKYQRPRESGIFYTDFSGKGDPSVSFLNLSRPLTPQNLSRPLTPQEEFQSFPRNGTEAAVNRSSLERNSWERRSRESEGTGKEVDEKFKMFKLEMKDGVSVLRSRSPSTSPHMSHIQSMPAHSRHRGDSRGREISGSGPNSPRFGPQDGTESDGQWRSSGPSVTATYGQSPTLHGW